MNDIAQGARAQRVDEVAGLVAARVAPDLRATLQAFVAHYYAQVDSEDLEERPAADLYGAALSHWNFARKREPGRARVRAFNPTLDEHGWQSRHTVVEIVNDDMPFLVDSVAMEVNRHGLTLHLIIHPIVGVVRAADGTLISLAPDDGTAPALESFIHIEVDRTVETDALERLAADIAHVLDDVRTAVTDWKPMQQKARSIAADITREPPPLSPDQLADGAAFLAWLAEDHFTFLGYRCHDLVRIDGQDALHIVARTASASCAKPRARTSRRASPRCRRKSAPMRGAPSSWSSPSRRRIRPCIGRAISTTLPSSASTPTGRVCGEHRFLGLFTQLAYSANPSEIPLLRRKTSNVIRRANLPPGGHAEKGLVNILDSYPRDELLPDARGRAAAIPPSASCIWAIASVSGCSSGAIRSSASSPA